MNPSSAATVLPAPQANAPPARVTFDELYAEYFDMVWRAARRLGAPDASVDDVTQDVFLVLHRRLPEIDEGRATLRSWVYGVVVRVVRDHRRSFRRKEGRCVPLATDPRGDGEAPIPSSAPPPSAVAERNEAFALLCALLDELDEDKRELLVLSELEEMTVPEIARILGANVQTVYSRLRAARKAFDQAHTRYLARTSRRRP